jgi:CheY-like chemotaxis protein
MRCPRCQNPITVAPDPGGFLICPGCGARLTTRPARARERPGENPNATLPPGTPLKKIARPGEDTARSAKQPEGMAALPGLSSEPAPSTLEAVLAELRALRRGQDELLRLARIAAGEAFDALEDDTPSLLPPVRSRQRKTVLLVDDDPKTREASLLELQAAEISATAYPDGRSALEAMAREKPDVIAIEVELQEPIAGKDVINMIKATMDWVDIPIVLYTRAAIESQREARQVHGADDVVLKRSGPAALVSKVVALFRR